MEHLQKAIEKTKGPCIILAGAGTGKTHTIVEKLRYLIENKIYTPEKIVCLTFSNEATNEMRKRILPLIQENEKEPIIRTFHSFCSDLLKKHGDKIGIRENFKILLPDDAKIVLHKNLRIPPTHCSKYISEIGMAKDVGINHDDLEDYLKRYNKEQKEDLEKRLSNLQFQLYTLYKKEENKNLKNELKEKIKNTEKIINLQKLLNAWKSYEKLKAKKNLQDYSDLNKNALSLLKKHPDISKEFEYVIVDEFQDTNKLQCDLLENLSINKNITVVGDLNQSIYRFRGAYKNNLENFKKAFNTSEKDIFTIDKSRRSTNKILRAANKLISLNYKNKEECFQVYNAFNEEGEKIKAFELKNNKEEARKAVEIIKQEINLGTKPENICLMFRTHQQARALKTMLEYENIPYTSVTKKSLLKLSPITTSLNYIRILEKIKNQQNGGERAWWYLIHQSDLSDKDSITIGRFLKNNRNEKSLSIKILNSVLGEPNLSENGQLKLKHLLKKIKDLIPYTDKPVPEIILRIYKTASLSPDEENEDKEKLLILQKFHSLAQEYSDTETTSLSDFIYHIDVINNLGIEIESPALDKKGIRIMTSHATKGLEYDAVIISNLSQKRFPMEKTNNAIIPSELSPEIAGIVKDTPNDQKEEIINSYEQENRLLEERRLCYVSFTRTKKRLYLTYAKEYNKRKSFPSQFLTEINYNNNPDISFEIDENEISSPLKKNEPKLISTDKYKPITEKITFSPSSLQIFNECQKKYEYKYIYHMPDPEPISWEAMKLGSFMHMIFEKGVQANFKTEKDFIDLAKELQMSEEWRFIELQDAFPLIKIFYERNKDKYNSNSLTEVNLNAKIKNLKFYGKADRIDILHDKTLEIIDYKTGSTNLKPQYRNWQLGFYAWAAESLGLGKPKKITLDLLKKEKPLEFEIDKNGNALEINSKRMSFNLEEVKSELVNTAKSILKCYEKGFSPCEQESNCPFCDEHIWGEQEKPKPALTQKP